jgi:membrane protein
MTIGDVNPYGIHKVPRSAPPPSWVIVLSAALLATGMIWRSSAAVSRDSARRDPTATDPTHEDDRGRSAAAVSEIPWRGWKDVLLRLYQRMSKDRLLLIAAGVTFYLILAIFPGISALVSIYGVFFDPRSMVSHLDLVAGVAPGGAMDILREQLTRLSQQSGAALSISFLISLVIALWSATSGVKAIFDGLNVAYEEEEKRSFIKLTAFALVFTLGLMVFVVLAFAAVVALPVVLNYLPLSRVSDILLKIARWPILFVIVAFLLSVFYRYGPSRAKPLWRWVTWGSLGATLGWLVVSILFSWYVANFGSYNKTYGSLGAIIGFMTWVWLSISVILLGGLVNAETEHQTAQQTTSGPPRPLGSRGAKMADTIGAVQT